MRWADRRLAVWSYYYGLCTDEKDYRRELKRMAIPKEKWPPFVLGASSDATCHFFEKGDGKLCAIVCIKVGEGRSGVEIAGLLVHEAIHIWQAHRENIGETSPSSEFEAYAVQCISQELMQAYADSRK